MRLARLRFSDMFPQEKKPDRDDPLAFLEQGTTVHQPQVPPRPKGHLRFSDMFPVPKEEKPDPLAFLSQPTSTSAPAKPKGPNLWQQLWQNIGAVRQRASEQFGKRTDINPIAGFMPASPGTDALVGSSLRLASLAGQKLAAQTVGKQAAKEATQAVDPLAMMKHASQSFVDIGTLGMIPKRDEAETLAEKAGSVAGGGAAMLIPFSGAYSMAGGVARAGARAAPRVLGKPVAQEILKGTFAGALQGGGDALIRSEGDLRQAGIGATVGAGLGGTLGGVAGSVAQAPARRLARNVEGQIVQQPTSRTFRIVSHEQRLDDVLQQIQPKVEQRIQEINAARKPPLERKSNLVKYIRDEMPDFSRKQLDRLSYDDLVEMATEIGQRKPAPNVQQIAREEAQKLGYDLDQLLSRASRERPLSEFVPNRERVRMARAAGVMPTETRQFLDAEEVVRNVGELRKGARLQLKDGTRAIVTGTRGGNVQLAVVGQKADGSYQLLRNVEVTPQQLGATIPERTAARMLPETQARLGTQAAGATAETAATVQPGQIVSRRDIVRTMRDRLGIPIRQAGYDTQGGTVLGKYNVRGEGIRVASLNDIETVAHEVGHHLDKQLGLVDPRFDDELMAIGRITSGEGYTPNQIRDEGVAEFVNWYITDPELAKKAAPRYFAEFDKRINADKQLSAMFKEVKDMYAAWKALPPEQQILSQISTSPTKQKRTLRKLAGDLNTAIWDELAPIQRAVEDMTGGQALNISEDPFQQAWLARGWAGKAETALEYGLMDRNFNKIGPSFREIIKPVAKDLDNFRSYATARRVMELADRGIDSGFDVAAARKTLENFGDNKLFQETFERLGQYQDHLLEMLVESGIMSRTDVAAMKAINQEYLPFYRVFEDVEKRFHRGAGKGFADIATPVKRIAGSDRDIIDPLESIIKDTYYFTNLAERNKVGRLLAELADNPNVHGASKWIEEVDPTKGTLANVIAVWRDGQKRFYQVDPDLYRAMKFLDEEGTSVLVKFLSLPASWLRAGATMTPRFSVFSNPFKDQLGAFVFSNYGYIPFVDFFKGMFSVLRRDDLYWRWRYERGSNSIISTLDRDHLQRSMRRLLGLSLKERLKTLLNPIEVLRAIGEVTEASTRIGEFKKALKVEGRKPGGLTPEGAMRAALSSRDLTLDFARMGSRTKTVNRLWAFFNAAIQEPNRIYRAFRDNPKRTTIRALTGITLPTIWLYTVNRDNPEYWKRAQWERDLFWLIPIKGGKDFFRVPKPFLLGQMFGTTAERIMKWVDDHDPSAFKGLGGSLAGSALPGMAFTGLGLLYELPANYNLFLGREIVPETEQGLEPYLQYGPYTSETAKAIGRTFNVSPYKVEHAIKSSFAGMGQHGLAFSDWLLKTTGAVDTPPAPTPRPQDHQLLGTLYSQTGGTNSQFITDFYDGLNELRRERNSARRVLNDVEEKLRLGKQIPQKDIDLIRRARANEEALREQEAVAKELSELRKSIREIEASWDHTPEQKRALITQIEDRMNQLANRANQRRIQVIGR